MFSCFLTKGKKAFTYPFRSERSATNQIVECKNMKIFITYALLLLWTITFPIVLHAEDKIIWATPNWPPFHIVEGANKGKGISDAFIDYLQEKLKDYNHKIRQMNFARYHQSAQNGQKMCMVCLLKNPEREKVMHYSIPMMLSLAQSIVIKKSILTAYLGNPDEISLEELLNNPKLWVIFEKGRSYGKIDSLIQKYEHRNTVKIAPNKATSLFQMMLLDRVHYMIEYPYAIANMKHEYGNDVEIVTLRIKELPPYVVAYATCSKTEWGKMVIEKINRITQTQKHTSEYQELFRKRMEVCLDKKGRQRHKKLYYDVFLKMQSDY